MGWVLLRRESPSFKLGLEGTLTVYRRWLALWKVYGIYNGRRDGLPRGKLISGSHELHDLLQTLLLLDVHLEADVPLPCPVVHHYRDAFPLVEVRLGRKQQRDETTELLSDACCRCCTP